MAHGRHLGREIHKKIHFVRVLVQTKATSIDVLQLYHASLCALFSAIPFSFPIAVLQELHEEAGNIILVAAVFDGHGGTTASETASQLFPGIFSTEVSVAMAEGNRKYKLSQILGDVMESTWKMTCNTYRNWYDTLTSTGSVYDLVPGTTAVAATFSMNDDDSTLHILNCGDSRALLIGRPQEKATTGTSFIHFSTKDHSPNCEIEAARLLKGVEAGLNYSLPENSLSRSWLTIGGYQYEVSRSLEGSYATSKGIVSTPDMFQIDLRQVLKEKGNVSLILASDGLFEWIGNEELSREVVQLRDAGYSAKDAAKSIVGQALKKGTSDNISVVVIYFS
jgi:serine/threonine protein phosphatase PrpC